MVVTGNNTEEKSYLKLSKGKKWFIVLLCKVKCILLTQFEKYNLDQSYLYTNVHV